MLGTLGHRVRSAALDFASWAPSAGVLLLLATDPRRRRSPTRRWGPAFEAFWEQNPGVSRSATRRSRMSLRHWVNDGLLTIFFLVVGLEIKREFTVGHLASRRSAALPIAAAIGGMVVPALLYVADHSGGPLVAWLGRADGDRHRLRRRADRDDGPARAGRAAHLPHRRRHRRRYRRHRRRGGLLFRRRCISVYLGGAAALTGALALLNRSHVYRVTPYVLLGIAAVGLRACRRPARDAGRRRAGAVHSDAAAAESEGADDPGRTRSSTPRRSTAAKCCGTGRRCRRCARSTPSTTASNRRPTACCGMPAPRSSYLVLPLFALANAGVVLSTRRAARARAADARDHRRAGASASRSAWSAPRRWRCGSGSRSSRRTIPGGSSRAPARWPASASPCRCSSPARPSRRCRLRRREDRRVRRLGLVGDDRCRDLVERPAREGEGGEVSAEHRTPLAS